MSEESQRPAQELEESQPPAHELEESQRPAQEPGGHGMPAAAGTHEYPAGSDKYPPDSAGYRAGSDEYSPHDGYPDEPAAGSGAYPARSDEYPPQEGYPDEWRQAQETGDADDPRDAGEDLPPGFPFRTIREFQDAVEASWDAIGLGRTRRLQDAVGASMPGPPPGETAQELGRQRPRSRQVGIKLTPEEHRLLAEAARRHAVAVGTLARVLAVKGARALLDERGST